MFQVSIARLFVPADTPLGSPLRRHYRQRESDLQCPSKKRYNANVQNAPLIGTLTGQHHPSKSITFWKVSPLRISAGCAVQRRALARNGPFGGRGAPQALEGSRPAWVPLYGFSAAKPSRTTLAWVLNQLPIRQKQAGGGGGYASKVQRPPASRERASRNCGGVLAFETFSFSCVPGLQVGRFPNSGAGYWFAHDKRERRSARICLSRRPGRGSEVIKPTFLERAVWVSHFRIASAKGISYQLFRNAHLEFVEVHLPELDAVGSRAPKYHKEIYRRCRLCRSRSQCRQLSEGFSA